MKRLLVVALILVSAVSPAAPPPPALQARIEQFLDLYSKKDIPALMDLLADEDVLVMGELESEVCTSRAEIENLLRNDFTLWDTSHFGKPLHVSSRKQGSLVTAFFDAPFTIHRGNQQMTVTVRFATVWTQTPKGFKLLQTLSTTARPPDARP